MSQSRKKIQLKIPFLIVRHKLKFKKAPMVAFLEATQKCNMDCVYCSSDAGVSLENELSMEQIKVLIKDFKKLGVTIFNIIGGEPLLRKEIREVVKFGAENGMMTNILTNATLLDSNMAGELKDNGLSLFSISLDGSNEAINSFTRGNGSFEKILKGIDCAVATGLPVLVKITLHKNNTQDIENTLRLLIEKKVSFWTADFAIPCGRERKMNSAQSFSPQEKLKIIENIYDLAHIYRDRIKFFTIDKIYYNVYSFKKEKPGLLKRLISYTKGGCGVLDGNSVYVNSDGSVRPCPFFPFVLPDLNIKKDSIVDIYKNNKHLKALRNRNNLKGKCLNCKFSRICGGCRAKIYAQTGDFFAEDAACILFESV
ncbi:MAG: radical SAM protein [Candidatus Gygaella obscura]|nr:radical SAM protein [Candidatus Gygaella obscura]